MFNFSTKTEVRKVLKLSDIFKQIGADKEIRKNAQSIKSLILNNVISKRTLNTDSESKYKEIYVFKIAVDDQNIPLEFIKKLDDSIKFPTLFILESNGMKSGYIAYKYGNNKGKFYSTSWNNNPKYELPLVTSVDEIYKFIFSKFLKYEPKKNESVDDYLKRHLSLAKLDFQINSTQIAINKENQSKKKFEYNSRLKKYKDEREKLLTEDNV